MDQQEKKERQDFKKRVGSVESNKSVFCDIMNSREKAESGNYAGSVDFQSVRWRLRQE